MTLTALLPPEHRAIDKIKAYNQEHLIKGARKLTRKYPEPDVDILTLRVAIANDSALSKFNADEQAALCEMAISHNNDYFPLPNVGTHYKESDWSGIYFSFLRAPWAISFNEKALTALKSQAKEYGEPIVSKVSGNHYYYFGRDKVMHHVPRYVFSTVGNIDPRWPRTPQTLKDAYNRVYEGVMNYSFPLLEVLSDHQTFNAKTNPQSIADAFIPYAKHGAIIILKDIHYIRFGHHNDASGRLPPESLWEGKTVEDVRQAERSACEAEDKRFRDASRARGKKLAEFARFVDRYGNHPATLTKKLKKSGSDIRLVTARQAYSTTASIDLGERFKFVGSSASLKETVQEAVKSAQKYMTT